MKYRADIDGLRALAVLTVIVYHAGLLPFASGGFVGVDVFFVISGYLIYSIVRREIFVGEFSAFGFYERRIRRIFPALFAVLFGSFAVAAFILPPNLLREFTRSMVSAAAFFSNFHFLAQTGYFESDFTVVPLLHTWSLGIEEQFYLVAPLVFWLMLTRARRFELPILGALTVLSLAYSEWLLRREPEAAFYLLESRAWELALGASLVALPSIAMSAGTRNILVVAGLGAIGGSVAVLSPTSTFPGLAALPACLGTSLILYAGIAQGPPKASSVLMVMPMRWLGQVSYSLYLWHWPLLAFANYWYWGAPSVGTKLAAVSAAFVLALGSWRFIERPFRGSGAILSRRAIFAYAFLSILAIVLIANVTRLTKGLKFRYPELDSMVAESAATDALKRTCLERSGPTPSATCDLGHTAGRATFVVWGDSHAESIAPAFDIAAKNVGMVGKLFYQYECPPLLGVAQGEYRDIKTCSAVNDEVVAFVKRNGIRNVYLVARWAYYTQGSSPSPDRTRYRSHVFQGMQQGEREAFRQLFSATVQTLIHAGVRVTVVAGTPEFTFDVPNGLVREQITGNRAPRNLVADHNVRHAFVEGVFEDAGVTVIKPISVLCGEFECPMKSPSGTLYKDSHHLSDVGAVTLLPMATGALQSMHP